MTVVSGPPRGFAVWSKNLNRWDCSFYRTIGWRWPAELLHPVGSILRRKQIEVSPILDRKNIPIIEKITFGGRVSITEPQERGGYKGRLFWANKGDLIYSKIRVKQGSLAVVPDQFEELAVSSEYPVYSIDSHLVDPTYLVLVLKSKPFLSVFESLSHGGSTKTRIPPAEFERQLIPLPPLGEQKAILAVWRNAQTAIATARNRIEVKTRKVEQDFLENLGLQRVVATSHEKAFSVAWRDLARWGVSFNRQDRKALDPASGKFPVVRLSDVVLDLENGWSPKCLDRPAETDEWGVLKLGAVSLGIFNAEENKALPSNLRPIPALEVKSGQVLISRANITRLVGACAWVEQTRPRLLLCDKIFRVVFRENSSIEPVYLSEVLKTPQLRSQIESAATGTSATMQNITKPSLLALRLPLPPLGLQRAMIARTMEERAEIWRERESLQDLIASSSAVLEALIIGNKKLNEESSHA